MNIKHAVAELLSTSRRMTDTSLFYYKIRTPSSISVAIRRNRLFLESARS